MQLARGDKAIAAIVALSADHANAADFWIFAEDKLGNRGSGIFHQCARCDSIFVRGDAVNLAHLGRGHDLHTRAATCAAMASSFDMPLGSPMTISVSPACMSASAGGLNFDLPSGCLIASTMI